MVIIWSIKLLLLAELHQKYQKVFIVLSNQSYLISIYCIEVIQLKLKTDCEIKKSVGKKKNVYFFKWNVLYNDNIKAYKFHMKIKLK